LLVTKHVDVLINQPESRAETTKDKPKNISSFNHFPRLATVKDKHEFLLHPVVFFILLISHLTVTYHYLQADLHILAFKKAIHSFHQGFGLFVEGGKEALRILLPLFQIKFFLGVNVMRKFKATDLLLEEIVYRVNIRSNSVRYEMLAPLFWWHLLFCAIRSLADTEGLALVRLEVFFELVFTLLLVCCAWALSFS
jgi:hypothetical protein